MTELDIVERLRSMYAHPPLLREAASEIERLREEIVRCHDALLSIHKIVLQVAVGSHRKQRDD